MSYNPRSWANGDIITPDELNAIEQGLAAASASSLAALGTDPAGAGYDLILVAGQSNAQGQNNDFDARTDPADSRVWVFEGASTYSHQITRAVEPMVHQSGSGGVGPGLPFARWYASTAPSNRRVLLVPAAVAGTALTDTSGQTWHPQVRGSLYDGAIAQTNAALAAAGTGARIVAVLWVQGEQDAGNNVPAATYQPLLDALIGGLRRDLAAPNLPFIVGSMVPETYGSTPIAAVHAGTPTRVRYTAYVQPPTGYARTDQTLHYTAAGQRVIGRLMALALPTAVANTSAPAAPLPGPNLTAPPTGPTYVAATASGAMTAPTVNVSALAGDFLVAAAGSSNGDTTLAAPTGVTGLTWTLRANTTTSGSSNSHQYIWTAPVSAPVSGTLTFTATAGAGTCWASVQQWRGVSGVGATISPAVISGVPSASITTTAANSGLSIAITDFWAVSAAHTWITSAGTFTEAYYLQAGSALTAYSGAVTGTGTAGAKTVGVSAPSGQVASLVAVELLA